ncbi:hypothetical protein L3X38_002535 [Prunus dulcis]|uniref:Uncharacterized protein n=1 Tax=Prunus dulcis TaxID=3755 RepID=A0AAD4WUP8_PRUDU|nr:hypothetical protein L3X38_002535 [Prunus dulcis]
MFAQQPAPFKEPDRDVQSLLNLGHVRIKRMQLTITVGENSERTVANLLFLSAADFQHVRASHMITLTHIDPSSWHKKKKELKQFGSATKRTTQTATCSSGRSRTSSPVTAGQPE